MMVVLKGLRWLCVVFLRFNILESFFLKIEGVEWLFCGENNGFPRGRACNFFGAVCF